MPCLVISWKALQIFYFYLDCYCHLLLTLTFYRFPIFKLEIRHRITGQVREGGKNDVILIGRFLLNQFIMVTNLSLKFLRLHIRRINRSPDCWIITCPNKLLYQFCRHNIVIMGSHDL